MKYRAEDILPILNQDEKVRREFEQFAYPKAYARGQYINLEGDHCNYFYMVLSGSVRVYKSGECGREVTLYKVKPGESCILSAFSIMNNREFPANAVTEEPSMLVEIPESVLRDWLNRHELWRAYLFTLFSTHLQEIISKVEYLAFYRVDERIANYLIQSTASGDNTLHITHSDIARELGTAREVVSRILKTFEKARLISLSRKNITVIDEQALLSHGRSFSYAG